jgi:DNA ligase D-like protein (predicted 3'-phosphoesterase)
MGARRKKLDEYAKKRDFRRTPEPSGGGRGRSKRSLFVVQKHDASTLHYDFRLEVDGVLKSWAVPKGPSTDPRQRRLAVMTEDHPLDYADFEGVIPAENYGAGSVIVWDLGTYENIAEEDGEPVSMKACLERGQVAVRLSGEKIRGGYALVRSETGGKRWLLIKMKDEDADARRNPVSTEPRSVVSGRTVEEVAEAEAEEG